jgi:DNA-binding response OmpR family regulator
MVACMQLADCTVNEVATIGDALDALQRSQFDVVVWGVPVPSPQQRQSSIAELKLRTEAPLVLVDGGGEMAQGDLEAGADQWLPKPFVPGALVGAVRAALRNRSTDVVPLPANREVRGIHLDGRERTMHFNGAETSFSRQEWDLLSILIEHPNRYLTSHEVLRLGWHAGAFGPEEVRIYMRRLRKKMEPLDLPCELVARHGHGYCLKFAA